MNPFLKTIFSTISFVAAIAFSSYSQGSCCCGTPTEIDFPGFDFEFSPEPAAGWFIAYPAGVPMGPWDVTSGFIDHVDKEHYYNTGYGNPNGPSNFADLYGSPASGSMAGILKYTLTGLKPNYHYTLELFYSKFDVPGNFTAVIKIANGAWLTTSLTATNPGNIIWLKASYNFIAKSTTANLEFIDQSSSSYGVGLLIDDIKIYECPNDISKPVVNNPPVNNEVECEQNIPAIPILDIKDNCDADPKVTFKEYTEIIDNCTKKLTREWIISDECGNSNTQKQIIDIIDKTPPQFNNSPLNYTVFCDDDVTSEFNTWIKKRGNANASDECTAVTWRIIYDHQPSNSCDSILVEFIAEDECGNQANEFGYFIVRDTLKSKFVVEAKDKNYGNIPGIRDSLREWLMHYGFSKTNTSCDPITMSSNFNGDSTKNPLQVTFYAKDKCGNIDSSTANFSYQVSNLNCCCGTPQELNFPGLDFEFGPDPPVGGFINYQTGIPMGPWNVTSGAVDHVDKNHFMNSGYGNPNGPSNFIDLYGSPGSPGTIQYVLYGLTPGNNYTIEFYYACFDLPGNYTAVLKIANGAWLNVSWKATNPGNVIWLKASYNFTATSSSANLEFTDTGGTTQYGGIGVLIDDIKIFGCPVDNTKPVVSNPPVDEEVECEQSIPPVPTLDITDNCDANPKVTFKENTNIIDNCTKKLTREWIITDACGNSSTQKQIINIVDKTPPQFNSVPVDKTVLCNSDVITAFNDWIKKRGNAFAIDGCSAVNWRITYDHPPTKVCDSLIVEYIAEDECGNQATEFAYFIVSDTSKSKFIAEAQNKNYGNISGIRDSLRKWLSNFGYSKVIKPLCDTLILSSNFKGDSTRNPLVVTFYVKDRCGNIDSTTASFSYQNNGVACCCGVAQELYFDGFDFEISPAPAPAGFFYYVAGNPMGQWNVISGAVDIGDKAYCGFLSGGNPNGASNFMDLFGSPPTGSVAGTVEYLLTGLTPGNNYTIEFWYATFTANGNFSANLKIANGAWLNVNWSANNPGASLWLKKSYTFIATATSAVLSFMDTGASSPTYQIGMLIDDIKIFECPGDLEKPVVDNSPNDLQVECDQDVPIVQVLDITDNCDLNPMVTFKETKDVISPCTKKITREWTIQDACGNITTENQIIDVIDNTQPVFVKYPENKYANCSKDLAKEFDDWIKKNGNAIATDACGMVTWRSVANGIPKNYCDSIQVDFIATDHCGNEIVETAYFIVKDSTNPKFVIKPQDKNFNSNPNIRDSLRTWLNSFGFSKTYTSCDTTILSSNFDGDSTKNPIVVTFYVKDRCGNIDSATATFSYKGVALCCCGAETELFYPNLDFEAPAGAPPGGWTDYYAGDNYAGWNITSGSISIHDPAHLNLGNGNPNGSTQHMDLHGANQGSASYVLTGLTAGYRYTISFWYAIHSFGTNVSARLTVNGGSLLNVSWNASNTGDVIWFQTMYDFIADGPVATMEFIGTGSTGCCGMLIDDIQIFECPGDSELPVVTNPPDDIEVECEQNVPPPQILNIMDNCDSNPKITLKESKSTIDPCTKKITRTWEIKDACGNVTTEDQVIDIIDRNPPVFTKVPEDKLVYCIQGVAREFNEWVKRNGNATAADNCGAVTWRSNSDHLPNAYCDTVLTEFFVTDHCGNENSAYAFFIVRDTSKPKFIVQPQNKNLVCVSNPLDTLRVWLDSFGFSKITTDCDTALLSHNFDGDSTKNPIQVTFYAKDRCGNIDSSKASFFYRGASDTFRITNYSCSFPQNSIDTFYYKPNGCDSIVILEKIRRLADSTYIQANTCDPQQVFDTLNLMNVNGCDSLIFLEFILRPTPDTIIQKMDCAYKSYSRDTMTFTGQYCDSIVITEFIPLKTDSTTITLNTCDQSQADTTINMLVNRFGCDSVITVYTIYTAQKINYIASFECGLLKNYTDTAKYQLGNCDSLVVTNHFARPLDTTNIQSGTCDKSAAGIFTERLKNTSGCDSLVIENIILLPTDSVLINNTTCIQSQAGFKINQFTNQYGCDSIVTSNTVFTPSDTSYFNSFTCNKSAERHDTVIITTQFCDSIVISHIDFIKPDTTYDFASSCDKSEEGTDTIIHITKFCDSIVIKSTVYIPSDTLILNSTTCIPSDAGTDTLHLFNSRGCDSLVFNSIQFVPEKLLFQLDSISCYNLNDGRITILNQGLFTSPLELLLNNQLITNQTLLDNLTAGQYNLFVRDKNGCLSDTISFQFLNPDPFTTELGPDLLLDPGQLVKLNLLSNKTPDFIYWQPSGISSCNTCQQIDYNAQRDEWIYTLAIDERGCESKDSIFIRIKESTKIFAPNAVSNNGDNINDYFYLIGDDKILIELLEIYDRWGELIFSTTNIPPNKPESGWDGTFKDEKMNPGVFVYYARVKHPSGNMEVIKGDFTLVR